MKTKALSLGNIILLKEKGGMRELSPKQIDENSRGPQGNTLGILKKEKKDKLFVPLHSLGLYKNHVSSLRTVCGKKHSG